MIIPQIPGQRWSCHSCGQCCRSLVGHLLEEDRKKIDGQGWADALDVAPYVRIGREWVLNKRADGACVFLDENNLCKIHSKYGESAKPFACRVFPFSVRPVRGAWQASFRFDCPSSTGSKGQALAKHAPGLKELVKQLRHPGVTEEDVADLQRGVRATAEEINMLIERFRRWFDQAGGVQRPDVQLSVGDRLVGAARLTETLYGARFKKVRGRRLGELLDILFTRLPTECSVSPGRATAKQRAMLRQLSFAHAEHVSLAGARANRWSGLRKRWQQLGYARRFRIGRGAVPRLPGADRDTTFEALDAVEPAAESVQDIDGLLLRYVAARLEGRAFFGAGFYGWPVFAGLGALWLSIAATGWLARYRAAMEGRTALTLEDASDALGVVDQAATRLPALGSMAERVRVAYLLRDDGVARLIHDYSLTGRGA